MFYRKSIFDQMFKDLESLFDDAQPVYYKVGPNGYVFTYSNNSMGESVDETIKLKSELQDAVESQDFEKAVELRDKIKSIEENGEKISNLQTKLQKAIDKQDFEKAIELRDEIKKLQS